MNVSAMPAYATFELADAIMTTRHVSCLRNLAYILYFGVSDPASTKRCKIVDLPLDQLMQLYIQQMSQVERPVLAIDHTAWLRPHAPTLKERTYEHQPTPLPHGIPVGIGQGIRALLS
ncbi:hypothetical protein [Microcoleus sp. K5-D4]|uniref:hypothetical protein n=1 Tax=Microcoleus sp. K5-D4 TaxID=2818801 RepID=UPI002FD23CE7